MSLYSKLFLRTKTSPYGDFTRNSVLSFDDLDQNFLFLKERDIQSFSVSGTVLNYNTTGGDIYSIDLDSIVDSAANVVWKTGSTGNFSIKAINDSGLDATGNYSVAEGYNTLASGEASHAEGIGNIASGNASHAEGGYDGKGSIPTSATTFSSHAEGYGTLASGSGSHAEGGGTIASGDQSHAEGNTTIASGLASHAEGEGTIASNTASHAEGNGTIASGNTSHAEGYQTIAGGEYSHAEGESTVASGDYSHAEGYGNIASGPGSHAEGGYKGKSSVFNIASGISSHAEGYETIASGNFGSHAEGFQTQALGESSHSEGVNTIASGYTSHAEGEGTLASGGFSHAEGEGTRATGTTSHAEGQGTRAFGDNSHAEGRLTEAAGDSSHAEGSRTTASGTASHAEGQLSNASGSYSHAEGRETISTGTTSHAEGYLTQALGEASHAEGYGGKGAVISSGTGSHAEGVATTASGNGSHAEGEQTVASGGASHAEGGTTTASGDYSHAEGSNTKAIGPYSHTEGLSTSATTEGSHAEGLSTLASGDYSHAEGEQTVASGQNSHAEGYQTTASGKNAAHAEGNETTASGDASHSEGSQTTASGDFSHAGGNNSTASGANSFIHSTNSLVSGARSAVLGGQNITGATDDTVYVPYLNIGLANGGTSIAGLSLDANNNVITGATGLSSGSCISDLYVTNIHGCSPVTIKDDLIVEGDLTILGSATTVDIKSEEVHIADNFVLLNSNVSGGTPTQDSGIDVRRGDQPNGRILWNETDDRWEVGTSGTTYEVITTNNIGSFTGNTLQEVLDNGSTAVGIATDVSINKTGGTHDTTWSLTDNDGGISQTDGTWTGANKVETSSLSYLQLTNGTITSQIAASKTEVKMDWTDAGGNNILAINSTSNTFTDGINSKGLEYASDYSSNFTNESLVTKRYVTGITSTLDNFYVTGFTYDDVNTFTLSRNGGLGDLTATVSVLSGITYYGDGSNLSGISTDNFYVTGGTYNSSTDTITLNRNDNQSVDITGVSDTFTTGATYDNGTATATFTKNDATTYTLDLSTIDVNDTFVTGFTYDDANNFTLSRNGGLSALTATIDSVTGLTVNGNLNVNGETVLSGSAQNVLTIVGSGSTDPLFKVEGSAGELFTITDSLTGTLFAVNDISGLPILEVNSDDEILMGNYQAPSLNTTFKTTITSGSTELYSIPVSAYTGGFFEYTLTGAGARAGSIMSIFSGSSVNFTETTTTDIGDTSSVTFDMNVSGGTANLTVSATTGTWEIKTIVRSI